MEPVTLRHYRSDDAVAVTQLFHDVYGDHYVQPQVYLPCMVTQNQTDERWHSLLAVSAGRVVGHAALIRAKGSRIAELALSVVHPDARGRNLATRLGHQLLIHARSLGCLGVTIKQVTRHPYTQRMAARLGFLGTGILPDYAPSPFGDPTPESVVIGYASLCRHPMPALDWPTACREFMQPLRDAFGTCRQAPPWRGPSAHFERHCGRIDGTFRDLKGNLPEQLRALPSQWLISVRLRLSQDFMTNLQRLSQAGFVFSGVTPDERGEGWLALFHRGMQARHLQMHCPRVQRLHERIQAQAAQSRSVA